MDSLEEISKIISKMNQEEILVFFKEILTLSEITTLSKRWRILKMLASKNYTQRDVAKALNVSLCKVTRGAKILKQTNAVTSKIIESEENNYEYKRNN